MEKYVEIIHMSNERLRILEGEGEHFREAYEKIRRMENEHRVHHLTGILTLHPENVSFETSIILGGAILEYCVKRRESILKNLGYLNVTIDRTITFSESDFTN